MQSLLTELSKHAIMLLFVAMGVVHPHHHPAPGKALASQEGVQAPSPTATPPSSTSSAPPTTSYGCLSSEQVGSYARGAGFPESVVPVMVDIAMNHESGGCPGAINPDSGACGLWQLNPCTGGSAWLNPATNAALAYAKYQASGLSPWGR